MDIFGVGVDFSALNKLLAVPVLAGFAILSITDKLVWHTRLRRAEARADRWEDIALRALSAGAEAGVKAAEVTVDVVSAMPDPNNRGGGGTS